MKKFPLKKDHCSDSSGSQAVMGGAQGQKLGGSCSCPGETH